jgi:hypothetical protein
LPPEADRIVLRAMAKMAGDRYASAGEMRQDLERALAERGGSTSSLSLATTLPPTATAQAVPVGRTEMPTVPIDDSDIVDGMGDRLRRADVDDYEWGLRRRRLLARLLLPLGLLAAVAGGVALWLRFGGERADLLEHEPNNTPGYANLLPLGAPLRGTIGKLNADGHGDVDYFRVPAGKGPRALDVRLEGIPGVDLLLELFDAQGRRIAKSDEHGKGWGEWLQPTALEPGESYLAVRELWIEGTKPTEDAADPYTLTARWGPPRAGWEREPNDWPAAATPLGAPGSVRGYLGRADDQDWFAISAEQAGPLTATVSAPAGVDVVLLRDREGKRPDSGDPIDKEGAGGSEEATLAAQPGTPLLIGVARKLAPGADPKAAALQGLDDPYELKVEVGPH